MLIVSQDKEKVLWFGRAFNALEYYGDILKKGNQESVRHTICISDGCLEEVAEYKTKERCLEILCDICRTYENECFTAYVYDAAAQANVPFVERSNTVYEMPEE